MNDRQLEKRLTELLDGICAEELAGADDILEKTAESLTLDEKAKARISSKALRKAGIVMKDSKNGISVSKGRKKTIAAIAALAAALGVTMAAGAYGYSYYTDHKALIVDRYGSEASELLEKNGAVVNDNFAAADHIKISQITSLSVDKIADTFFLLEAEDDEGAKFLEEHNIEVELYYDKTDIEILDEAEGIGYFYGEGYTGIQVTMMGDVINSGKSITAKFIPEARTDDPEYETDGGVLGEITFKPTQNLKAHSFKSSEGKEIQLSDYFITCDDYGSDQPIAIDTINITFKDGSETQIMHGSGSVVPYEDNGAEKYKFVMTFDRMIDSENVVELTLDGERFSLEQNQ